MIKLGSVDFKRWIDGIIPEGYTASMVKARA
jgi:hypothetical protein